ncbi:hypothetical protein Tco_0996156 [Tanacetum coccineum]
MIFVEKIHPGSCHSSRNEEAFKELIGEKFDSFINMFVHNVDQLEKQLEKDKFHEYDSKICLAMLKKQFETFFDPENSTTSDANLDSTLSSQQGECSSPRDDTDAKREKKAKEKVMGLENTQNNALAKFPMLKLGDYEMWEIRIKQYFQIQDYTLWEVIENGNSWVPIPVTKPSETGTSIATNMTVPSTIKENTCKKNDVKARNLLLIALPNEHQLTFDQYVDTQSMFAAIKARFGGNEATKKSQKALLKQQYENFNASSSESLDSIFNKLQMLVSRLAIIGVVTPLEDLNVKFLRSLPSE